MVRDFLFDKVQNNLKTVEKSKWGRKKFHFSKLMKCGVCGSSICGTEHINRHGKLYVYYRCTKTGHNFRCKEKYIREEKLIITISKILSKTKDQHIRLNQRLKEDLARINRFRTDKPLCLQEYLEGTLRHGSAKEKSDLIRCLEGNLLLKNGIVYRNR